MIASFPEFLHYLLVFLLVFKLLTRYHFGAETSFFILLIFTKQKLRLTFVFHESVPPSPLKRMITTRGCMDLIWHDRRLHGLIEQITRKLSNRIKGIKLDWLQQYKTGLYFSIKKVKRLRRIGKVLYTLRLFPDTRKVIELGVGEGGRGGTIYIRGSCNITLPLVYFSNKCFTILEMPNLLFFNYKE